MKPNEIVVDLFAGGGGASTGIAQAIDLAVLAGAFWERVKKADGAACWEWTGAHLKRKGSVSYGVIPLGKRGSNMLAHRFSYMLNVGPIDEGQVVRHRCDNPRCVRPDHLLVGTQADNLADMRERGRAHFNRFKVGPEHPNAKIDEEKVREIRRLRAQRLSLAKIGKAVGLHASTVHDVVTGKTWGHVA